MQEVALTNHDRQFVEQVRRRFAVWFGELRRVLGHSWAIFHNARVKPAGVGYQRSSPAAPDGLSGLLLYSVARQGCPIAAGHDCDGYHTGRGKVRVPADLLRPCDADQMTPSKVSPAVGNTRKKPGGGPKQAPMGTVWSALGHHRVARKRVSRVPIPLCPLFCWRPRRDLNPCYRRERAVSWAGLDDGDAQCASTLAGALRDCGHL
jgi:hypothetical protein